MTVSGLDMPQDLSRRLVELAKRLDKPAGLLITITAITKYPKAKNALEMGTLSV